MIKRLKLICILLLTSGAYAFSSGPPPSHTGAPGETTCFDCHDSFQLNRGPGSVTISGLPKIYQLGQRITLEVAVRQQNRSRWGFQITALDLSGRSSGQFSVIDTAETQLQAAGERVYLQHTTAGSTSTSNSSKTWRFDWIAPSTDVGPVNFYVAANAADANGNPLGDYIYTNTAQIGAPSDPTVDLLTPNGGEVLQGGQFYTITWSSQNALGHDIFLQTDGVGSIPSILATGLSPDVRMYQWRVPNDLNTTRARIIVVAQGQHGRSDSDSSSSDFTITPSQTIPGPTVSSVKINDKRIKATGIFKAGVTVQVAGVGFVTPAKLSTDNTTLIQRGMTQDGKTIGQIVPVGAKVQLKFINPDGGVTLIDYIRPQS